MNADQKKQAAIDFLESMSTRDPDVVLAGMTDEPAWGFFEKTFPGKEGVRSIVTASAELYEPDSTERVIHATYCEGDTVIVKTSLRARTFKGEDYENMYIMILHLEGDKVRLVEEFMDTAYGNEKFSGWEMSD